MAAALLILLWLSGCSVSSDGEKDEETDEDAEVQQDPRTLVEVASVAPGSVASHLVASATIESEAQTAVMPEAQGVVTEIRVEEGDEVVKGQILAVIASPALDAAFQRASTELERAATECDTAERLFTQGAISRTEVDGARQALKVAKTAHHEASLTRGFTRLTAPISGTIATRGARFGELTGVQPAFTIVDLARLRVVVPLPERDLSRVRAQMPVKLTSAYDAGVTGDGVVERVAPVVDSTSGTFRATVRLLGATTLRPGQFVSAQIEVDRHEDVLTVPRRALVWEEGKAYVFRIAEVTPEEEAEAKKLAEKEKGEEKKKGGFSFSFGDEEEDEEPEIPGPHRKAVRVAVEVGFEDGETAEMKSGVTAGDQVIIVGNQALRDGARVRLPGDPTTVAAAETPAEAG